MIICNGECIYNDFEYLKNNDVNIRSFLNSLKRNFKLFLFFFILCGN